MAKAAGKLGLWCLGRVKRFAAVDVDCRRLRVVLAELSGKSVRIRECISAPLPERTGNEDPVAIGELLRSLLRESRFNPAGVVMSVPRSQAILRPISLPAGTPPDDVPAMVHYQVGLQLPFPPEDAVIDFAPEKHYDVEAAGPAEPSEEIDVLAAAIRLSTLDRYRQIAEAAGTRLLRLSLRPCANMRCVQACGWAGADESVAVVSVTADETEIDIVSGGSLAFSRATMKEAPAGSSDRPLQTVEMLVGEVARSLQSYQSLEGGKRIDAAVVAGDTNLEPPLAEALTRRLGVPCEMLRPSAETFGEAGAAGSSFIAALGLALGQGPGDEARFDFQNPKRPINRSDPRKRNIRIAVLAGLVLLMAAGLGVVFFHQTIRNRTLELAETVGQLKRPIAAARSRAERVDAIEEWADSGRNWLDHWAAASALLPSAKEIYLSDLRAQEDGTLTFNVQARTHDAITKLGRRLNAAGYPFRTGQVKRVPDRFGYVYATTIRVETPVVAPQMPSTQPARPTDDSSRERFYESPGDRRVSRRGRRRP